MNRFACFMTIAICTWFVSGCKDAATKAPETVKVSGTVNLNNKPMEEGEIRFTVPGQPPKSITVKNGAFSGEVHVGKNLVEVVQEKDAPNPMNPAEPMKINMVSPRFSGPESTLSADIGKGGASDLKFDVTSAR